ncbi:MAG TPA: glycoside hydrolase family 15 protein [Flavipsychrobacter sp.]|nr:glycoside hydrolase family 15 protein [Flavipsychrobacter sp.]
MEKQNKRYEPIENYGIIGDLHTVALISIKGSLDFMSFTRFDSPTVFAKLLDADKGGYFSIHPRFDNINYKQLYLPDSAILVTRFLADDGISELIDYMPVSEREHKCAVIRKITTVRGKITYNMQCCPRFNYALAQHTAIAEEGGILFEANDENKTKARLLSTVAIEIKNNDGSASFTLEEGQTAYFVFESMMNEEQRPSSLEDYVSDTYKDTSNFWQGWIEQSTYTGRWREIVNRSLITLKLLTSYKYGSVIAAPTFSLPETIGGERNWDYRYTWIRDAAFTMYVFLRLGFIHEAGGFLAWIKKQCMNQKLQLMYAVDGETCLPESFLEDLEGYKGSRPVRIGNEAHEQFQLDIYGELLDTIYLFNKDGGPITYGFWQEIEEQVNFVLENWEKPDHGIWEVRHEKMEFLYSRVMCWVAIDRAIKIAEDRSFPYPLERWHDVRDKIYLDIYTNFWNEEKQAFVQHKGSSSMDASALLMPLKRFISPYETKWLKTMSAIDKELRSDVLIYRYRNNLEHIDGLQGQEGTFTVCSFWYVECLAKAGRTEEAREIFEKMLGYANHLGLFAEEIGSKGQHLGNFPQAFTHLGLISAAIELNKDIERNLERSDVASK